MITIKHEYYNVLDEIYKLGSKRSPCRPWPNPTVAFMCIKGWIKRSEHDEDIVVFTGDGRFMHQNAKVVS